MPDPDDVTLAEAIARAMPLRREAVRLMPAQRCGLVVIDEVNGFATTGAGNLAPPTENPQVERMIIETDRLARAFVAAGRPVLAFLDSHIPGKPEPPYPPHCEMGSGEDELVPMLAWLAAAPAATLVRKDCINGFVGAFAADGSNRLIEWVKGNRLGGLLVVGICTDICVMDFVLTALSARNHGMLGGLADIFVYEPGCATYDLSQEKAVSLGLGADAAHPQAATHYLGLYFMASRGARIAAAVEIAG